MTLPNFYWKLYSYKDEGEDTSLKVVIHTSQILALVTLKTENIL